MKGRLVTLSIVLLLATGVAWGDVTARISGSVSDPTGAVIPGAAVTARNTDTGIVTPTQTNAQGFYSFPALAPGKYEVFIKAAGFEEYRQTGLVLDVNTALRVDAVMSVGAVTQEVSVSATAVHVDTSNTQMGEVITSTKMTDVPLNGRSYTDLMALQPGVAPASSGEGQISAVSGNLDAGNISISGQRETANGFMVNGGAVEETLNNAAAVIPDLDSIAEFRILTDNADAEYGNYAGGLVNVITKSGTNKWHGSAFEFLRNPNLDSRNFYSPTRAVLHQNQFGGTGGGALIHDKLFIFADYQGTRQVQAADTGLILVPSATDRNGNVSDVGLTGNVTGTYWASQLSSALDTTVTAGEPYSSVFPGSVIPQSVFTAPSNALMKYIPLPNLGPYFTSAAYKGTLGDNKGSGRVDANTRLGLVTGYYYMDDYVQVNPYGGASVPGFATTNNGRNQMVNVSITKSLGPNSVNELRLSYMRDVLFAGYPLGGLGVSMASQGFTGIFVQQPTLQRVESIGFNSYSIGASSAWSQQYDNTQQISDNFSKVVGTHTLKFGGGFHYDQMSFLYYQARNGEFGFNGGETGYDFADFLIGAPNNYQQGAQLPLYARTRYYGFYGQDSWRATQHLTVNYGLRWEVTTPWWETHNQMETLLPGVQSLSFPGAPAGWLFPGDPGVPSTLGPTRYGNFGPRIGIAYSPHGDDGSLWGKLVGNGRTSIRAAYGIYYTSFEAAANRQEQGDAPYGYYWYGGQPEFATPFILRESGINQGQRFPTPLPPLNVSPKNPDTSINWSQFEPIESSPGFYPGNHVPYGEDYNFSLQRQFGNATMLMVSYVGSEGHKLFSTIEANPANPALCLSLSQASEVSQVPGQNSTCGPFSETAPGTGYFYPAAGGQTLARPLFGPAFGGNGWESTEANSVYNSLQVSFRHQTGRSEFMVGYTYSKSIDNSSGDGLGQGDNLNPIDTKITRALSAFNVGQNFVASYSYELPFQKLWRANRLTEGWQVSGITRFATGFPVYMYENDDHALIGAYQSGQGNNVDTPNYTPGSLDKQNPRTGNPYFNTSLFSMEALGQLGTANRRFFSGPGWNNFDLALSKEVKLTESMKVEVRGEFFNAFNHAQFQSPQGTINNGTFGYVTGANAPRIGQVSARFTF